MRCSSIAGFLEPLAAKTWAAGQALQFGKEMGFFGIILEGDAKLVVDAINLEANDLSRIGHLVLDVRNLLHDFEQWKVQAMGRHANNVAHCMATFAKNKQMSRMWKGDYLECIREFVLKEFTAPPQ